MPVFSSLNRLSKRFSTQAFPMTNLNGTGSNDTDIESSAPSSQPRFMSMLKNSFQDLKKSAQTMVDSIVLDGEDPYPSNPYSGEEITNDDLHSYLYGSVNFTRFPIPGAADELAKAKEPPRYERYLRQSLPPAPEPISPDLVSDGGSSSASTPLQTPTQTPSPSRLSLRTSTDEYRLSNGYGLGIHSPVLPSICVIPPTAASAGNRNSRNFLGLKVDVSEDGAEPVKEQQNNGMFVIGEDEEDAYDAVVEIDLNDEPVQVMRARSVRIN
jgi:hypothetical protein